MSPGLRPCGDAAALSCHHPDPAHHLPVAAVVGGNVRAQLREQLNLPGSTRADYLLHMVLCWCAVCQEARELKYRSVLSAPPRPSAKLLEGDTAAPQIQLMRAESRPRGALIKEWKGGTGAAVPAGSASSNRAASRSLPKQAAPMAAVPEAAAEGAAAEAQGRQQPPAVPAAEAAMPSSESGIEEMLRAQSMRVEMAVQAAKRIEAQATQKELELQQESAQRR